MKIKIHSSLKNIRLMVSIGIPIEEAVALAASTIVEATKDEIFPQLVIVKSQIVGNDNSNCGWALRSPDNQFTIVEP